MRTNIVSKRCGPRDTTYVFTSHFIWFLKPRLFRSALGKKYYWENTYVVWSMVLVKRIVSWVTVKSRDGVNFFTWVPLFIFIEPRHMKQEYWIFKYNSRKYVISCFYFTIQNKIARGRALTSKVCHLNLFFVKYSQLTSYAFACISPINAVEIIWIEYILETLCILKVLYSQSTVLIMKEELYYRKGIHRMAYSSAIKQNLKCRGITL